MAQNWTITTPRLHLAPFAPEHLDDLHAMNSDPEVTRYLAGPQTRAQVKDSIERVQERWAKHGFSWWTMFLKRSETIIGAACLQNLAHKENAPLEIGWRLMTAYHGHGYATEAGQAAIDFGFDRVGVDYLCAVANSENTASQNVMRRLGMRYVGVQTHYDEECAYFEINKSEARSGSV